MHAEVQVRGAVVVRQTRFRGDPRIAEVSERRSAAVAR